MSAQEVQPEVTLDFTSNDTWKIPVKEAMGTTEQTFTNGTYSIKLAAPDGYYYNTTNKFLMLGKKGATLTLPAFTFPVSKIEVVGTNGASSAVEQNIFVGESEVSTKTVGAKKPNTYEIGAEKIIDTYAVATQHVDQGLSLALFYPDTVTTRDLNKSYIYAWRKGIKTLYYMRLRQMALEGTAVEGCVSCML